MVGESLLLISSLFLTGQGQKTQLPTKKEENGGEEADLVHLL
jgi:hypothetical protein